jgi:hypothetical protein
MWMVGEESYCQRGHVMVTEILRHTTAIAPLELIALQFHSLLARHQSEDRSRTIFRRVILPAIGRRVLKELTLLAMDRRGFCRAFVTLAVDWARHGHQMRFSRRLVTRNKHRAGRTAPRLNVALDHFDELVEKNGLRVTFRLILKRDSKLLEAVREARLHLTSQARWASRALVSTPISLAQELPELSAFCAIAEDWSEWP